MHEASIQRCLPDATSSTPASPDARISRQYQPTPVKPSAELSRNPASPAKQLKKKKQKKQKKEKQKLCHINFCWALRGTLYTLLFRPRSRFFPTPLSLSPKALSVTKTENEIRTRKGVPIPESRHSSNRIHLNSQVSPNEVVYIFIPNSISNLVNRRILQTANQI